MTNQLKLCQTHKLGAQLVLKKFYDLQVSMEFRVWVKDRLVVGISQRDCAVVYQFLSDNNETV